MDFAAGDELTSSVSERPLRETSAMQTSTQFAENTALTLSGETELTAEAMFRVHQPRVIDRVWQDILLVPLTPVVSISQNGRPAIRHPVP